MAKLSRPQNPGNRGMALIAVLWVISLLSVIAFNLSSTDRTASKLAFNAVEKTKARQLAEGAIQHAIFTLMTEPKFSFPIPQSYHLDHNQDCMLVSIDDEDAKIDLNKAPLEMIQGLFFAVGAAEELAAGLAKHVIDSRPLLRVEQLFRMPGVDDAFYRALQPHITVHGKGQGIDPLRASDMVLRSLPGMSDDQVAALRESIQNNEPLEDLIGPIIDHIDLTSHQTFSIRAFGESVGGGQGVREAVVALETDENPSSGGKEAPFRILAWRYGEATRRELQGNTLHC